MGEHGQILSVTVTEEGMSADTDINMLVARKFDEIRVNHFPKWDRKGLRQARVGIVDVGVAGDFQGYSIAPDKVVWEDAELSALLIHEICRAFSPAHGKKWRRLMLQAAHHAKMCGDAPLSRLISCDVKMYEDEEAMRIKARRIFLAGPRKGPPGVAFS